jgi:progressive ankylosis protein
MITECARPDPGESPRDRLEMSTRARAPETLTERDVLRFWAPLAATWLMMSVEGPFIAAVIARLGDPEFNLAAYGVAFSLALVIESPIVMALSAATALVRDRQSFLTLRRFIYSLNTVITAAMLVLLVPPVFRWISVGLMGLPVPVARLTHLATAVLLPWPAAIGYRRFYQGVLVRHKLTRRVAYGTVVRLTSMTAVALLLDALTGLPGALVGAAALSSGVVMEAVATRLMARGVVHDLVTAKTSRDDGAPPLTTGRVVWFYYPLALTSILAFGINPLLCFFLGRGRLPIESLAVLPVVMSLVFVFRSGGIAYQEVSIALLGDRGEHFRPLAAFARRLGGLTTLGLAVVAFTPLATFWFERVSGLPAELARLAVLPVRLLTLMPALEVLLSLERGLLVHAHRTRRITWATVVEVAALVVVLLVGIVGFDLVGIVAAATGLLLGRLASTAFLARPALRRSETVAPR